MAEVKNLEPDLINHPLRIGWWRFLHFLCYLWVATCYRYRAYDYRNIPADGPVLLVSNHQSFLDPILVGLAAHRRRFFAMARSTLFRGGFAWLIRSLNAIPVERGSADTSAMRACLEVLQKGHPLLVFPEGTRTNDGATQAFSPGTMLLIKRSRPAVVPVAIEGAFEAWPRDRKLPRLTGRIRVRYGQPVPAEQLIKMKPDAALAFLQQQVETMRRELAQEVE